MNLPTMYLSHMSRYNLFADFDHEKERYFFNKNVINAINGKNSVLEISIELNAPFDSVNDYILRMYKNKLLTKLEKKLVSRQQSISHTHLY